MTGDPLERGAVPLASIGSRIGTLETTVMEALDLALRSWLELP